MNQQYILNNRVPRIVELITRHIRTDEQRRERWRFVKKEIEPELASLIGLDPSWPVKAYELVQFDIDEELGLILMNYTKGAHNVLHDIDSGNGWTPVMRQLRGLLYSFGAPGDRDSIKLVSRGFEKFFNRGEVLETREENLPLDSPMLIRAKEDGAMVEFFDYAGRTRATTRGRINTLYVEPALDVFGRDTLAGAKRTASRFGVDLMCLVTEFIHPMSKVHVDYDDWKGVYLLAAYDTSGNKLDHAVLRRLYEACDEMNHLRLPEERVDTLRNMIAEMKDRTIHNKEGWVAHVGDMLVKLKYETYIGLMVAEKLSYRYVMNQMINGRCQKMFHTLPEELREHAWFMVQELKDTVSASDSYWSLYNFHNDSERGRDSFRQICRNFWRELEVPIREGRI